MAIIDAEHRRFMELSAAKNEREDEFANGSVFDEAESIADDGENGDDEVADPGAMISISDESLSSRESCTNREDLQEDQEADEVVSLSPELTSLVLEDASFDNVEGAEVVEASFDNVGGAEVGEASVDNVEGAEVAEGYAVFVYPLEDESQESCSRETLHNVLLDLNVATMELAYLKGQEHDIVPRSADVGRIVLDGIFASIWGDLLWERLGVARAVLLADFFCRHGNAYGGYNRVQLERLKQLPIFVNIRNELCALRSESHYFLIPPELNLTDIPLPPDAQQCFLKSNPNLNAFYQELGVEEMSDSRLLIYVLPMYGELPEVQRTQILQIILRKWQSLRHNTELISLLSASALFSDGECKDGSCCTASSFCDPRNSVLTTIFDGVRGRFPARRYRTPEWLDLMSEIGLQTEVTADIFVECAERIDERCSDKQALSAEDEKLTTALHQFFVQNYDKFDRSRIFFERITPLAFVPAILYEAPGVLKSTLSARVSSGSYSPRYVVRKYSECAIPDDQALVYTTMPILASVALPARVLFSRLCIQSPPPQDQVIAHLLSITNSNCASSSGSLNWQFFMPMDKVFQAIFQYLQENWDKIDVKTRKRLTAAAVIPVGSTLVKGSRLFFHLGENLAPLLYEVPRMFGAYDALFRRMGSKVSPTVDDYICLLSDLNLECCGHPLNLNELIAAARSVERLVTAMADSNHRLSTDEKKSIFLPSGNAVMRPMLAMAYNDSSALCSSIDITQLPLVHPRISTRCCNILGVPGATTVVTEELDGGENLIEMLVSDDIAHFTSVLASQPFVDGLRTIITTQQQKSPLYDAFGFAPDFEDLNRRVLSLAKYEVKCVTELRSRFVAKLDCPPRRIDVTKASRMGNLSFLDQTSGQIYIAKRTLEGRCDMGLRASYLVARCINQILGGILQDCSVLESILTCDEDKIPVVLQRLDVYEDPVLIEEKLRGVLGQPLCEADCANVELAPLRSCLAGELVAVEGRDGSLRYSKILREGPSDIAGVSQYEVKVDSSATRQVLATEVYFFRSARVRTGSRFDAVASEPSTAPSSHLSTSHCENAVLPSSVVTIISGADSSEITSDVNIPAPAVSSANILSAVNDLLSRLNVTLDMSVQDLMAENLQMQRRLEVAEDSRRAAATQIDTVTREKKELLDALVCAVCLENQVNRVLIPCGHIYCGSCVEQLPRPSCPICRQDIFSSSVFHVPS
uniref:RING-type domain-containing protein n=2 Tax=Hyaloperonospora arabidopsidis (strain Emoy2) TaxID=559515 RepID=M4BNV0_HYAAE